MAFLAFREGVKGGQQSVQQVSHYEIGKALPNHAGIVVCGWRPAHPHRQVMHMPHVLDVLPGVHESERMQFPLHGGPSFHTGVPGHQFFRRSMCQRREGVHALSLPIRYGTRKHHLDFQCPGVAIAKL